MIFDTDDFHETNHRLDLIRELRIANPSFRMTAFVVPGLCSREFIDEIPDWIECAGHGWLHGGPACDDPREAQDWTYERAREVMDALPERLKGGWKSPGWQVSNGTYEALIELGWWIADHPDNDYRRPPGIRAHICGVGDHVHTHVQNVCGNGIEETFPALLERVRAAESFETVGEMVAPWKPLVAA